MCNSTSGSLNGTRSKSMSVSADTATGTSTHGRTHVIVFSMAPATSDSNNRSGSFLASSLRNTATTAGMSRIGNESACSLNIFMDMTVVRPTAPRLCDSTSRTRTCTRRYRHAKEPARPPVTQSQSVGRCTFRTGLYTFPCYLCRVRRSRPFIIYLVSYFFFFFFTFLPRFASNRVNRRRIPRRRFHGQLNVAHRSDNALILLFVVVIVVLIPWRR